MKILTLLSCQKQIDAMDSQTFKIMVFVGLAVMLALFALLALGVTKDVASAYGGKFGLTDKDDEKTFVTNPGNVNVKLTCERNEKQLGNAQFLYKIKIYDTKLQSEGKDDIRPVLYFKSRILKAKEGVIPKEKIKTGNLGELNFELETVSLPTYTKEFYTLFLLKKSDKCENALAGAISEQILVSQCGRDLLAKFDASTNSCSKDEIPYIKLEKDADGNPVIERRVDKGVNECRPVFKVINNDVSEWKEADGYKLIIRNCESRSSKFKDVQKKSGIKDVIVPAQPDNYIDLLSGWSSNSGPRDHLMRDDVGNEIFCMADGKEKNIELYKGCDDDNFYKEEYCTNLYRDDRGSKPVLIQPPVPFTC